MPSPPFPQRRTAPEAGERHGRRIAAASLLVVLLASFACTTAPPPPPSSNREPVQRAPEPLALDPADRPYLTDPLEGYPRNVGPEIRERLANVWRDLLEAGDTEGALRVSAELREEEPDLLPAHVLAAQVDFAAREDRRVVERLLPVGDEVPTYTASQLLLGRAAERLGDIPLAYSAFRAVAARSSLARRRTGEMHPRAMEIVSNRLDEALRLEDLEESRKQLGFLQSWGPSELSTLEAAVRVAEVYDDRHAELAAIKDLTAHRPGDRRLLERQAELELAVGDPSAGLKIIQDLAARNPRDPALAEKLEAAKFRWRLSQLPQGVQTVAAKSELNKADLAVLLYWLVPDVRNSRPTAGRIATDVLDNPHQREIVRVVNLGLMEVDPTLHRFSPGSQVRRGAALRVILRTMARFGAGSCAGGNVSSGNVCEASLACGLVASGEACLPGEPLSGAEGVEILRRSLKHLGAS